MSIDRITRINELMRRVLTQALYNLIGPDEIDHAAVTIRTVKVTRDLHQAKVGVSILGHEQERDRILSTLKRYRREMQATINREMHMRYTPRLTFVLDTSVEKGDHVLDILHKLEAEEDAPPSPDNTDPENNGETA